MAPPPRYRYKPLSNPRSIRLLYIRYDETKSYKLSLSLHEVDLSANPRFCALSYTWKSPVYTASEVPVQEKNYDVECDGQIVTVSSNLFSFFQTVVSVLRRPQSATQLSRAAATPLSTCKTPGSEPTPESSAASSGPKREIPPPAAITTTITTTANNGNKLSRLHLLQLYPIWIDALCINQSSPRERQSQVLLMHHIYSRASHLFVYLSPAPLDPHSSTLFVHDRFIPALAKLPWDFVARHVVGDPLCESTAVIERLGTVICTRWTASWLGFANFLDKHRWFDRGWVVQEVALRRGEGITVLCGETELSWVRLAAFATFLERTGWAGSLRRTLEQRVAGRLLAQGVGGVRWRRRPIGWKLRIMEEMRRMVGEGGKGLVSSEETGKGLEREDALRLWVLRASSLVAMLRSAQFEDHRDHVYGSLGMSSQLLPEGMESPITPDYEKTTEGVFTSVAATFISGTKSLLELSQVEDRRDRRYQGLPSWVPDYSVHPSAAYLRAPSKNDLLHSLSHDIASEIPAPTISGPKLTAHGIRIDTLGLTALRTFSDTPSFRDDLLTFLLAAASLHTTALAADFFSALGSRRPNHLIRAQYTATTVDFPNDFTTPFGARSYYTGQPSSAPVAPRASALSRFGVHSSVYLDDAEEFFTSPSTLQPISLLTHAQRCRAKQQHHGGPSHRQMDIRKYVAETGKAVGAEHGRYYEVEDGKGDEWIKYDWRRDEFCYESFMTYLHYAAKSSDVEVNVEALMVLGQLVQVDPAAPKVRGRELGEEVWDALGAGGVLVATESGRVGMATGPSCAGGDEIWVLGGARAPVLLRRLASGEYRLVGEVFVQGVDVMGVLRGGWMEVEEVVLV